MALLVAIITFVTALLLVFAIWLLVGGGSEEDIVRRRLDAVRMAEQRGTSDAQDLHIIRDEMLQHHARASEPGLAAMAVGGRAE